MAELLLIGDLHLSDRPPSNCTDDYNDQLFEMLWEIVSLADARHSDAVVFAGDIFHLKAPSKTSHRTVQRMIEVVQAFTSPVYLVAGNHDLQNDRLDSIHETQPFGVLLKAGAHHLHGWAEGGKLPLFGVPWQQDWNGDCSGEFAAWRKDPERACRSVLVTHAPLYPPGRELPYENVPASTFASWMGNVGSCFAGHVHEYHGEYEVDGVWFCNYGALSRGSLHEEDLTRIPSVAIWACEQ